MRTFEVLYCSLVELRILGSKPLVFFFIKGHPLYSNEGLWELIDILT